MFKKTLTKPDGRTLELYARRPIPDGLDAPSPEPSRTPANPHLRWHPLRGEWIAYAGYFSMLRRWKPNGFRSRQRQRSESSIPGFPIQTSQAITGRGVANALKPLRS